MAVVGCVRRGEVVVVQWAVYSARALLLCLIIAFLHASHGLALVSRAGCIGRVFDAGCALVRWLTTHCCQQRSRRVLFNLSGCSACQRLR